MSSVNTKRTGITTQRDPNRDEDPNKQKAILLSVVGPDTYKVLRDLVQPTKPSDKTYAQIKTTLKTHFDPTPSVTLLRFRFNTATQKSGQSEADFVAELRHLSQECQYGDKLEEMLRDRLVCGIRDERIQRRLFAESNLTFHKAFDTATAMDAAHRDTADLKVGGVVQPVNKVTKIRGNQRLCYRCLGSHQHDACPFKNTKYHFCGKLGHLAKACKSAQRQQSMPNTKTPSHVSPKPHTSTTRGIQTGTNNIHDTTFTT